MEAPASLSPSIKHTLSADNVESQKDQAVVKAQEDTVREFASLLCSDSDSASTSRSKGLSDLLADSVADDSVILTLPSLDMRLSEEQKDDSSPLPPIGERRHITTEVVDALQHARPHMAASVLTAAVDDVSKGESKAVANLLKTTCWTKSTLIYASNALASNASDFFSNLIDSRVKAWTLLLLRHSLSTGDTESRARLLGMLSASIKVNKAETNFKTLSMPPGAGAAGQRKEADVILPLLFEVYLHLSIQDNPTTVKMLAPGTISADFMDAKTSKGDLKKVVVRLDTGVMLSSMVDQARLIVFKAVANVTKAKLPSSAGAATSKDVSSKDKSLGQQPLAQVTLPMPENPMRLSGFKSALSLSGVPVQEKAPQLQKARNSALRLNSILLGKGESSNSTKTGMRKVRSIKWNSPLQIPTIAPPTAAKKQRMAENAAKLTSFKSFGRPHGGDFGSGPRNATFGEYGRVQMWGRDGRLAHHPSPMQAQALTDERIGLTGIADKNATFDLSKPNKETASALPRTATGLENWLLKTSTAPGHNDLFR